MTRPPILIPVPDEDQAGLAEEWQDERPTTDLRPIRQRRRPDATHHPRRA